MLHRKTVSEWMGERWKIFCKELKMARSPTFELHDFKVRIDMLSFKITLVKSALLFEATKNEEVTVKSFILYSFMI